MAHHNTQVTYDPTVGLSAAGEALNLFPARVTAEPSSRVLTVADNGRVLECTATITLTVPDGLPAGFSCDVVTNGTTSIARNGTATLNGAGTTLTRLASTATNRIVTIQKLASAAEAYAVTGS
jgi:hypothetical protein